MNAKYFAALTPIVLATGLNQPLTHPQTHELVLTSVFNALFVQRFPLNSSLFVNLVTPPPERGAPSGRRGAAGRAAQPPVEQLKTPP